MKRILYITKAAPYPTNFGGGQRSNLILQALRELGEVDLISDRAPVFYHGMNICKFYGTTMA
jgi:hypothetical protein